MMEFDEIVVKESPGLCRCCLSEGCYKDLGTEYPWMSENEVYADMLLECFDISITQHNEGPNGPSRLICEVCITRLRDACNFKKQVLESEKRFIDMVARGEFRPKVLIYQTQMKTEGRTEEVPTEDVEYLDDDIDFGDDEPAKSDETQNVTDSITAEPLPVKGKRGRPRKSADVKTVKKMKVLDEKPKTSKAVTKDDQTQSISIEDMSERERRKRKVELTRLLVAILENSTVIPFRWHSNKYMCFYCSGLFFESSKLKEHMKEHRDVKITKDIRRLLTSCRIKLDVTDIGCKLCPKKLQSFEGFLAHISEAHDFAFSKEITKCIFTFKLNDGLMSCCDCEATFRFFGNLMKHVHRYHNRMFLCEICGEGFIGKRDVESHIQNKHVSNPIPCNKCGNIFQSASSLRHHDDLVHKDKFKCPKCPEILKSVLTKRQHLANVHDVKHRFKCDQCSQVFTRNSTLVHHKSRFHLKEKTVTCDICGFKVFNKQLLKRHMIKHDGSRPFECEFCKKTFQRKKTLELHTRIHTDDRRYACEVCGKAFVQVTSLKVHLKTHHTFKNNSVTLSNE